MIRLNKKGATGISTHETKIEEWHFSKSDDLAVRRMSFRRDDEDWSNEPIDRLLDNDTVLSYDLGIGDEIFSIGRFLDIDGNERNHPVVRFGNVSLLSPLVSLDRPSGAPTTTQESYLVEMRSRTGFSGSPIFIYIPPETTPSLHVTRRVQSGRWFGPWLMGMHWGQLPVVGPEARVAGQQVPLGGVSGMLGVVPANRIKCFLLHDPDIVRERREFETVYNARGHVTEERAIRPQSEPEEAGEFTKDEVERRALEMIQRSFALPHKIANDFKGKTPRARAMARKRKAKDSLGSK